MVGANNTKPMQIVIARVFICLENSPWQFGTPLCWGGGNHWQLGTPQVFVWEEERTGTGDSADTSCVCLLTGVRGTVTGSSAHPSLCCCSGLCVGGGGETVTGSSAHPCVAAEEYK